MHAETHVFHVERIVPETDRVKRFFLRPDAGRLPFGFRSGQHLGVRPRTGGSSGETAPPWRHFSLASSPGECQHIEIAILRQGGMSDRLHGLGPGDAVEVTRPVGGFVLQEPLGRGPVFFAGGIGMAPIRSMVLECLERQLGEAVTLFARFSRPETALFLQDIQAWARDHPRFSAWTAFTRAGQAEADGEAPRWDSACLEERIEHPMERTYHLCAPRGLMDEIEGVLAGMGVDGSHVLREDW